MGKIVNWLIKISQIPGNQINVPISFHGTDSYSAYQLMKEMQIRPRSETGRSSYTGSLSSLPSNVYLTTNVGKAAKHAIERSEATSGHPVVLVIDPSNLKSVHVDEDFVHMILTGQDYFDGDWYPSPGLVEKIFEMAAEILQVDDFDDNRSTTALVKEHLREYDPQADMMSEEDYKEQMDDMGIIPDKGGFYERDLSMETAKEIAIALNSQHQKEAIEGFESLAHVGSAKVNSLYLIPKKINISEDPNDEYWVFATHMRTYEDLLKYGEWIDPNQLLMPFMEAG